ncbi:porin family protein [Flaviaesturariibacter amylovorans]|uniref:Outer membrane protein beta-barrel domain-containing protein n=1 Tax=Flaviaesturariibacter amylovorans TaxID=1084520 RepID=A0ABP8H7K2_9BACT
MKILLLLLCVGFVLSAPAQLTLKPKAGVTLSRFQRAEQGYPYSYPDRNVGGFAAGAALSCSRGHLSLQAELLYNAKGNLVAYPADGYSIGIPPPNAHRFHYLELPLLAYYRLFSGLHAGAGGYYSYLLRGDAFRKGKRIDDPAVSYSRSDFGLLAELAFRSRRFEVGARYSWGLKTVQQITTVPNDPEFAQQAPVDMGRNRSLQLYVAYPIRF